jgi:hypothetical protein
MTLRLSIVNASRPTLDNGAPVEFSLDQRGALIGRSPGCDWSLPDARNHISSRHCEIRFEQGRYVLNDTSTNGTFLNDRGSDDPAPCASGRRCAEHRPLPPAGEPEPRPPLRSGPGDHIPQQRRTAGQCVGCMGQCAATGNTLSAFPRAA